MTDIPNATPITGLISTFLDNQSRRSQVAAANIANADTPGFTAKTVQFDEVLKLAAQNLNLPAYRCAVEQGDSSCSKQPLPCRFEADGPKLSFPGVA